MKKQINSFIKDLDSIEHVQPWQRTSFFKDLKSCHIETEESGQMLLVCDLYSIDQSFCVKMKDRKDADGHMSFFLEAKDICKEWNTRQVNDNLHNYAKLKNGKETTQDILVSFVFLAYEYNYEYSKGNTNAETDSLIYDSFCKMQDVLNEYDNKNGKDKTVH